jgi:hypothetical protein
MDIAGLTSVTGTALTAWGAVSDFLIVLVLLVALFLVAAYVGRGQYVALLLAFYVASAIFFVLMRESPYGAYLPSAPALTALLVQLALFAAITFVAYVVMHRIVVSDFLYISMIGLVILSFLGATFLMALAYHVFPVAAVYQFTPALDVLFASKDFFFLWFIAPAIGLFFLAR